ncbi:hypothetical protein Prubr_60340 [Polymorphospora rubra]|uniref:Beta-glucosidase n=1 Tax=Polymorphospora rubra TaxID=338584 RepID=A0A810NBU0_9ACTN|nr:hypothetical protein Prubr_60340 [Polymorphospora rubra]
MAEDGRTPSIWDTFCRVPGAIDGGDNGDVACDHYHRMPQDVALMRELEVDTYRFSVAWPRVQPGGRGPVNPAGLAFYDRLVDELLGQGIDPWITLYHWDLPQELQDAGGWPARDTAYRFADYSMLVFDHLKDRVRTWTTLNEPWCSAMLGYAYGNHAPGIRDFPASMAAVHHLLLGHGLATQRMRAAAPGPVDLGITLNMGSSSPATDSDLDREAARRADGLGVRIYLDPLRYGRYPADVVEDLAAQGSPSRSATATWRSSPRRSTCSGSTTTSARRSPASTRTATPPTPTATRWSARCRPAGRAPRWAGRSCRRASPSCWYGSAATTPTCRWW